MNDTELISHLKSLASKYETKEFLVGDPSWFMHQVKGDTNKELLAFIAANISYGSRKQFLPKIQYIIDCSKGDIANWLQSGRYKKDIPDNAKCFYRLYTFAVMQEFLTILNDIVSSFGSMKNLLIKKMKTNTAQEALEIITKQFHESHRSCVVVPKDTTSSCKRLCMFLRWMVRDNSPVDLGLWSDIIEKKSLIIPMDTHVIQEANRLGLLKSKTASMSSAMKLTKRLKRIFPDDPLKGDFALFGVGVTNNS